jgi:hypothetical protein
MGEKRKHIRYASSAAVQAGDRVYSLKDISLSGCCLRCPDNAGALGLDREYKVTVMPEPEAQVIPFDLLIELCWSRDTEGVHELGCFITGFPKGKQYQRFADYMAWRISRA